MTRSMLIDHQRLLIIAELTVQSSYTENIERPAVAGPFDTIQWWIGPRRSWRIRTFAADHDIHLHEVTVSLPDAVTLAQRNARKHYGDVLGRECAVEFADYRDDAEVMAKLRNALGAGTLEVADHLELAFWNPDGARYRTKSNPTE